MEPVIDSSTGLPASGVRYSTDSSGHTIKNRLWRGFHISDFDGGEERMDRLEREFQPRGDDVFILAYPKCGTHWMHEICYFLLTRQTQSRPARKEDFMLECEELEDIDKYPAPRILNCHLRWSILPASITSANRVVYVVRNPKDCAVSLYHHCITISDYEYSGTFEGFLSLFEQGALDGGSWFSHVQDFLKVFNNGQSNVLFVQYELIKKQPKQQIQKLAKFLLGEDADSLDDAFLDEIIEKVSFQRMKMDRQKDHSDFFNEKTESGFYRKGEIGDWKNWFSEEASKRFDELTAEALKGHEQLYQPIFE